MAPGPFATRKKATTISDSYLGVPYRRRCPQFLHTSAIRELEVLTEGRYSTAIATCNGDNIARELSPDRPLSDESNLLEAVAAREHFQKLSWQEVV